MTLRYGDDFVVQKALVLEEDMNSFDSFLTENEEVEEEPIVEKPRQSTNTTKPKSTP